jgi:hypothetical protein
MGLDMYAFATCEEFTSEIEITTDEAHLELHYWRKHPNLHGWMERLYRQKGGRAEFNCVGVQLTMADLTALQTAIEQRNLPDTSGFFFGATDGSETHDDLAFVHKAINAVDNGLTIYYFAWW